MPLGGVWSLSGTRDAFEIDAIGGGDLTSATITFDGADPAVTGSAACVESTSQIICTNIDKSTLSFGLTYHSLSAPAEIVFQLFDAACKSGSCAS